MKTGKRKSARKPARGVKVTTRHLEHAAHAPAPASDHGDHPARVAHGESHAPYFAVGLVAPQALARVADRLAKLSLAPDARAGLAALRNVDRLASLARRALIGALPRDSDFAESLIEHASFTPSEVTTLERVVAAAPHRVEARIFQTGPVVDLFAPSRGRRTWRSAARRSSVWSGWSRSAPRASPRSSPRSAASTTASSACTRL